MKVILENQWIDLQVVWDIVDGRVSVEYDFQYYDKNTSEDIQNIIAGFSQKITNAVYCSLKDLQHQISRGLVIPIDDWRIEYEID